MVDKKARFNHYMGIVSDEEKAANDKYRNDFKNDVTQAIGEIIYKYNELKDCNFLKKDLDKALEGFWEVNKDDILDMLDMEDENDFGNDKDIFYDPNEE